MAMLVSPVSSHVHPKMEEEAKEKNKTRYSPCDAMTQTTREKHPIPVSIACARYMCERG
jgi:hypothetical protein